MPQDDENKTSEKASLKERRDANVKNLRVESSKRRRSSTASSFSGAAPITPNSLEPNSPQPSVDRFSVTFAPESYSSRQDMEKVHFNHPSKPPAGGGEEGDKDAEEEEDDDEEDYSASVSAILLRRASSKRQPSRRRRLSSTFSPDGLESLSKRRSSNVTTTSAETAISVEEGLTEEHIFQNIKLHKEVLSNVKQQPWPMRRKMKLVKQAKTYVKIHEGELQERLAQSKTTKDMLACCDIIFVKEWQFMKRELANLMNVMVPWESRIKEIESHFGSVVASYFTFLRWLFWVNLVIALILITFVAIPEVLLADRKNSGERKELMEDEKVNGTNFMVLWDFEGVLKYSPIFYGYYSSQDSSRNGFGYKGPLAYFITGLAVYIYSFVATLRRMAENSRQSKLSEKDDECVFTWKLFTGWDYMIGNSETAHNRTASIILGFKEALLEEAEKKRDEQSWKMIGLRIFTNINVLWLFATSVYAVVFVVQRSTEKREAGGWWRQNEVTIVVSLITNLYPFLFEMLGSLEQYHPRKRLRMQLARIMVLNMLNLYTFILASFSKINDMTIKLQEIKRVVFNTTSPPAELQVLPEKHDIIIPTMTTISGNILYEIINSTQSSTTSLSPCYIEKVNCTKIKEVVDQRFLSSSSDSTISTSSLPSASSPSTFSTLATLILLSTRSSNFSASEFNRNITIPNYDNYSVNNYLENSTTLTNTNQDYSSISVNNPLDKKRINSINLKRNVAASNIKNSNQETKHFILPLNVELFNFGNNFSDDYYITPENYPDENENEDDDFDLNFPRNDLNLSLSAATDNDTYVSSSTESTTSVFTTTDDDGCQYITVCPTDFTMSSTVSNTPPPSLPSSESSAYYSSKTEAPSTTTIAPSTATTATESLDVNTRRKLRSLCWETMFGQELVKLTVMDLVLTILSTLMFDFIRAVFVRVMNNCWCWDLEKKFPQYGDFKIAENILHLVNNQGMVWMGMFFSPGLPLINLIKLIVMMYLRSWAVLTCNVPHEVVFRASRSNNFYLALLLTMLFLCVLPVSYAIVWVEPSWHCGPFSNYEKIYHLFTNSTKKAIPSKVVHRALDYIASPGIVIPLLMLLVLIIYYLISLTNALREANNDLKVQLRRERTEERRKVFQMVDRKHRGGGSGDLIDSTPFHNWQKTLATAVLIPNSNMSSGDPAYPVNMIVDQTGLKVNGGIKTDAKKLLSKVTKHTHIHTHSNDEESTPIIVDAEGTDVEQADSLPDDRLVQQRRHSTHQQIANDKHKRKHQDEIVVHHKHTENNKDVRVHEKHEKSDKVIDKKDMISKRERHETKGKDYEADKHYKTHKQDISEKRNEIHKYRKSEGRDAHEKHGRHHTSGTKEIKKQRGMKISEIKNFNGSVNSESIIPEIFVSQTDSAEDSQDEARFEEPSKSSSVDTIIIATDVNEQLDQENAEDDHMKKRRKVSYKIEKAISDHNDGSHIKEKHQLKHHQMDRLEHKEEQSEIDKSGVLNERKHTYSKSDHKHDPDISEEHLRKDKDKQEKKHKGLKEIIRTRPKNHEIKVHEDKHYENIANKHHHHHHHRGEFSSHFKEEKPEFGEHDHKEKEDKREAHHERARKHHDVTDDHEKHTRHHHSHEPHDKAEKQTKNVWKGKDEKFYKSEEETKKVTTKKKKPIPDKTEMLHHITSESSSKEDNSYKLKSKHKHNIDETTSIINTDDSTSKKHKQYKEKGTKDELLLEDKNIADIIVHKREPSVREKEKEDVTDVVKHKDNHGHKRRLHGQEEEDKKLDKDKELNTESSESIDSSFKLKKKVGGKVHDKKEDVRKQKKSHEEGKCDKELLPQTSSDNDEEMSYEPRFREKSKKNLRNGKTSGQSIINDECKRELKHNVRERQDELADYESTDKEEEDHGGEDDKDKDSCISNVANETDSHNMTRQDDIEESKSFVKYSQIKQKVLGQSKTVTLLESKSKQSSSDTTSSISHSQSPKSGDDDDDDDDDDDGDVE